MAYTFEQSYYFRPYRGNSSFWLNRYGNGSIASHQKATLYTAAGSADQRLKVHKVSGGCQLLSDLNNAYGLNIYGTKAGSVCDFYPVSGNFNDALIDLLTVDAANNLYRIKMINHNLYLTPASNSSGAALTWENASNADNQIWQLCASQSSGGGSTGGSTTITMPVNANQNYSGNSSWIINYGCAVCCGVDLASWKKNKSYTIRQIVSSGHYTGGFVCYGYQLVDQGRRNKRDKPVMDLVINEEESTWVRELFYKVIQEGASGYALAEMLNNRGLRTRAGAKFQSSNIIRIIRHEGYTGYIITKNARSEYIPELQIIDRETFDKANDIINRRKAKSEQERKIAHTSQNPTLLAGIVYCAHCGAKMSGFMHTDRYKLADGSIREKVQPKYNCFQRGQRNKGGRDCDGQALYLAEKVDAIVLQAVSKIFEQIRDTPYSRMAENRIRQESNLQKSKRASVEKKIKTAQHALERFEGEILKCLDGTSNFTEDMIAKQIRRYQQELDDAKAEYAALQNARLNEAAEIRKLRTYYDEFRGWAEEFDAAPLEIKRMILSQLIERVEVGRKYQVTIKLNMEYQQFLEITEEQKLIPLISA